MAETSMNELQILLLLKKKVLVTNPHYLVIHVYFKNDSWVCLYRDVWHAFCFLISLLRMQVYSAINSGNI